MAILPFSPSWLSFSQIIDLSAWCYQWAYFDSTVNKWCNMCPAFCCLFWREGNIVSYCAGGCRLTRLALSVTLCIMRLYFRAAVYTSTSRARFLTLLTVMKSSAGSADSRGGVRSIRLAGTCVSASLLETDSVETADKHPPTPIFSLTWCWAVFPLSFNGQIFIKKKKKKTCSRELSFSYQWDTTHVIDQTQQKRIYNVTWWQACKQGREWDVENVWW